MLLFHFPISICSLYFVRTPSRRGHAKLAPLLLLLPSMTVPTALALAVAHTTPPRHPCRR